MKYKIIVDKQPRTNPSSDKKEYEIDIEELRSKDNVCDSLIITKDEDYIMRRLELTEFNVLNILNNPVKQPIKDINIELFEGKNYIYLVDMIGNRLQAEYLVKNRLTDDFATKHQMNSAINQTAQKIELFVNHRLEDYATAEDLQGAVTDLNSEIILQTDKITNKVSKEYATKEELEITKSETKQTFDSIELEVSKKVNNNDFTSANILLIINNDTSEAKINADKVEIEGKAVRFKTNTSTLYTYTKQDVNKILNFVKGQETLTVEELELYDIDGDGEVSTLDAQLINLLVVNNGGKNEGIFEIDPYNARRCFFIKNYKGEIVASIGNIGGYFKVLNAESFEAESVSFKGTNNVWLNNEKFLMQSANGTVDITPEQIKASKISVDDFNVPEILHGHVDITPSAPNTPTGKAVLFEKTFSATPDVFTNAWTGVIGTQVLGTCAGNLSRTGFTAFLTRTNTYAISVNWLALN